MGLWTLSFEIMTSIFLIITLVPLIRKKEIRTIFELGAGILFGFLLEYANVYLFKTYHYNSQFYLQLGTIPNNIPLCIAMAWGMIMVYSHHIISRYHLPISVEIFAETLLGLTLDIIMDVIAVRLDGGFWIWEYVINPDTISWSSFYGVPWGNYYGWFCVLLISSVLFHIERVKISEKRIGFLFIFMFLMPIIATLMLIGFLSIFILFGISGVTAQFPAIYAVVAFTFIGGALIYVIVRGIFGKKTVIRVNSILPLLYFISSYLYFFIAGLITGIFIELWVLIIGQCILLGIALIVDLNSLDRSHLTIFG